MAEGVLDVQGDVPRPLRLTVPLARVNAVLGTEFTGEEVAALIEPIGFACEPAAGDLVVTVPTDRPDVRPSPHGIDDVIEEVGRTYGYSRLPRRQPSWPQPGGLTDRASGNAGGCARCWSAWGPARPGRRPSWPTPTTPAWV